MATEPSLTQYRERINELQAGLGRAQYQKNVSAVVLAVTLAFILLVGLLAARRQVSFLSLALPVPLIVWSSLRLLTCRRARYRTWRLLNYYQKAIQRVEGNWVGAGANGEEFQEPHHPYAQDLNVFGEGSLFELLCTARTGIGEHGLADYLRRTPSFHEVHLRQEAIQELRDRLDLRERIALLGEFQFFESKWKTFSEWLDAPALLVSPAIRATTLVTSTLVLTLAVGRLTSILPWSSFLLWFLPLVLFHALVGLLFRERVRRSLGFLHLVSVETQVLLEGLRLLEQEPFQSTKLQQLAGRVRNSTHHVAKLERWLGMLNQRNKEWFYAPSLLLLYATQLCAAIEEWRAKHRDSLQSWIEAWGEFEALNSLANYAYENPENCRPELCDRHALFEAAALGHPLLARATCVPNDVGLQAETRFYLVSGSNMSGKSTLLRAIGLNAVLAYAGAPVRAKGLRLSQLSVFASLSVVDSLMNGKSKFLAEVDKLRQTLEGTANGTAALFLIDEIFSGTNSRDRRIAAESVLRTLVSRGAIGALSTHDLALTEIAATAELGGSNVHMGSRNGSDPMDFDYRLKPGVTTESNALAIARMAGVPV